MSPRAGKCDFEKSVLIHLQIIAEKHERRRSGWADFHHDQGDCGGQFGPVTAGSPREKKILRQLGHGKILAPGLQFLERFGTTTAAQILRSERDLRAFRQYKTGSLAAGTTG